MSHQIITGIGIPVRPNSTSVITGTILIIDPESEENNVLKAEHMIVTISGLLTPSIVQKYSFASAFVAGRGGWSSHGVILARAQGIPCLVGVYDQIQFLRTGALVSIDILAGTLRILS